MPKISMKTEPDQAALRILKRIENTPKLGSIQGNLSREDIYGDKVDERY